LDEGLRFILRRRLLRGEELNDVQREFLEEEGGVENEPFCANHNHC